MLILHGKKEDRFIVTTPSGEQMTITIMRAGPAKVSLLFDGSRDAFQVVRADAKVQCRKRR